jgi:hypothetical protein
MPIAYSRTSKANPRHDRSDLERAREFEGPMTSLGAGARCELNDHFHLLGYVGRGIENADETEIFDLLLNCLARFEQRPDCSRQLGTIFDQPLGPRGEDIELGAAR